MANGVLFHSKFKPFSKKIGQMDFGGIWKAIQHRKIRGSS